MVATAHTYDLLVIGFGKAGKTIAMKRAKAGDSVALIERDPQMYGGTCINIACIPTKTLLVDADRHRRASVGAADPAEAAAAFARSQEHRDGFIAKLNAANLKMVADAGVEVVVGEAHFVGPHEVAVDTAEGVVRMSAPRIVVNTGSAAFRPDLPGIDLPRVFDSTSIQHIEHLPAQLAIVGGGPIGLEFATLFSAYGTKVTLLETAARPLSRFDEDVASCAADILRTRGVEFVCQARTQRFEDVDGAVQVILEDGRSVVADAALVAVGRRPEVAALDVAAAGIELTERGAIKVDEHLRTSVEGVWAAGDVNGGPQFTYVSFDDHRVILADVWPEAYPGLTGRSTAGRTVPTTTFLEPPLATVGLSEEQAAASGRPYAVKKAPIASLAVMPRPKILGESKGMAKFIVDTETDLILGAALLCTDAQELINTVAVCMAHGVSATELGQGIYTHPSSSEVFNALLG